MTTGNIVIIDGAIAVLTRYKMDPNFIVVEYLYPKTTRSVIVHRQRDDVTVTPITLADLGTSPISDFPTLYPEYFI